MSKCTAIIKSGKRKGEVCGRSIPCRHHSDPSAEVPSGDRHEEQPGKNLRGGQEQGAEEGPLPDSLRHIPSTRTTIVFVIASALLIILLPRFVASPEKVFDKTVLLPGLGIEDVGREPAWSLKDRAEIYMASYRDKLGSFNTTITTMILLILIAASVLYAPHKDDRFKIPGTGIRINYVVFHLILPAAMLFLWLQFGYLIHSIITDRLTVFHLFERAGEPKSEIQESINASLYASVNDGGFIDIWFRSFLQDKIMGLPSHAPKNIGAMIVGALTYGLVLGLLHGFMFALLYVECGRRNVYWGYFFLMYLIVLLSHVQFYWRGANRNFFQYIVLFVGLGSFALLTSLARQKAMSARSS